MKKRKLQIFLSSTYEDLVEHRLAAMETILAAGHIPAAMEQFSPGDETAWEKIRSWINESDGFVLILGGRYGSIEPLSGKSYVQLEYEFAMESKKPFFALVVTTEHHEVRVKQFGLSVDERERPESYGAFRRLVTERLCRFWNDKKDIQAALFQKLPEWAQRPDLLGWVRADEAPTAEVTNELARLSQENRELRSKLSVQTEDFHGLTLEEMVRVLREDVIPDDFKDGFHLGSGNWVKGVFRHAGDLFEALQQDLSARGVLVDRTDSGYESVRQVFDKLVSYGLASRSYDDNFHDVYEKV